LSALPITIIISELIIIDVGVWRDEQVLRRRYLLRPVALEVFLNDGYTHLLVLDVQEREPVFKSLLGHAKYAHLSSFFPFYI
jgi:hypothetical protein